MESYQIGDLTITPVKEGVKEFGKFSYPVRYGRFSEIRTPEYTFQFNLNGEIKSIQGRGRNWPHPAEWLKRTAGNDWVYYSAGDYKGVYDLLGEYYYPYLSYASNAILGDNPFGDMTIKRALHSWTTLRDTIKEHVADGLQGALSDVLPLILEHSPGSLRNRAAQLHRHLGGRVTVLPPDSRHVDYEVIPVTIAQGCLLDCGFCRVKSGRGFKPLSQGDIVEQMKQVRQLYGRDLRNYNAVFFGQHDALHAGADALVFAAEKAYDIFEFERSHMQGATLFLFGSPVSIIRAEDALFDALSRLPFSTYINVGLEAADRATLTGLRRPVTVEMVREAFSRMVDINRRYTKIEVTANFVFSEEFSSDHFASLLELTGNRLNPTRGEGAIYLSPIVDEANIADARRREIIRRFYEVKAHSHIPTFLYLIQRL